MISITLENDTALVQKFCEKNGVAYTETVKAYTAKDGGDVLGYSLFNLSDKLTMYMVETENPMLWDFVGDGLFRATLYYADAHDIAGGEMTEQLLDKVTGTLVPAEKAVATFDDCGEFLVSIKRCKD